eukprot:TRINITY_DN3233_c0_g1_i1.p1 TRINITY_DN3233_c0_g1~~TRINITY_DN3233_c0_g1_i1.p1  ORF type:complete len:844 (-),score=166.07 TRINITY_DN3233_c0_g1_i1:1405-3936(-)
MADRYFKDYPDPKKGQSVPRATSAPPVLELSSQNLFAFRADYPPFFSELRPDGYYNNGHYPFEQFPHPFHNPYEEDYHQNNDMVVKRIFNERYASDGSDPDRYGRNVDSQYENEVGGVTCTLLQDFDFLQADDAQSSIYTPPNSLPKKLANMCLEDISVEEVKVPETGHTVKHESFSSTDDLMALGASPHSSSRMIQPHRNQNFVNDHREAFSRLIWEEDPSTQSASSLVHSPIPTKKSGLQQLLNPEQQQHKDLQARNLQAGKPFQKKIQSLPQSPLIQFQAEQKQPYFQQQSHFQHQTIGHPYMPQQTHPQWPQLQPHPLYPVHQMMPPHKQIGTAPMIQQQHEVSILQSHSQPLLQQFSQAQSSSPRDSGTVPENKVEERKQVEQEFHEKPEPVKNSNRKQGKKEEPSSQQTEVEKAQHENGYEGALSSEDAPESHPLSPARGGRTSPSPANGKNKGSQSKTKNQPRAQSGPAANHPGKVTRPQPSATKAPQRSPSTTVEQEPEDSGSSSSRFTTLEQVIGQIYPLCKDQHGCRFLQKKLEENNAQTVDAIFTEVIDHIVELMTDPFGNYLCQKLLEFCNDNQRLIIIERVSKEMVGISQNMHGTRAVQKMIEYLNSAQQIQLVTTALTGSVVLLIQDLNGNHVIQRCLNRLSPQDNQFIYDAVAANCVEVATHRHGCCVLQRCIDHASESQKVQLVKEITVNALTLVQDPYGNYVVQYVLDLPKEKYNHFSASLIKRFSGHLTELSTQKFSSNVIEKCLSVSDLKTRTWMVNEFLEGENLLVMLQDPFANYVIQTCLNVTEPGQHTRLVEAIRPHLALLRNTPYGKRIQKQDPERKGGE